MEWPDHFWGGEKAWLESEGGANFFMGGANNNSGLAYDLK